MSEGPMKAEFYVKEEDWEDVMSVVSEELLLWEDKAINSYQAKQEVAEGIRVRITSSSWSMGRCRGGTLVQWALGDLQTR